MQSVEYLTIATKLTLMNYKKEVLKKELDKAVTERDIMFDKYVAFNTQREYYSMIITKTKEELRWHIKEKQSSELTLANLLAKRALHPQESELFPADMEHFEQIDINDMETGIIVLEKEIESLNGRLLGTENSLKEFVHDKEIINKHREICCKYQEAQQAYNECVQEEYDVAKELLLFYRKNNS